MGTIYNQWLDNGLDAFAGLHVAESSTEWITDIHDAIRSANLEIESIFGSYANNEVGQLGGFYAEAYHAGSFNINAAKAGSSHRAFREGSTANGSPDISTSWGEDYGSKYNNSAGKTLLEQARASEPGGPSKYVSQERLVPSDQLTEAQKLAFKKAKRDLAGSDPETANRYQETGNRLTDRLRSPDEVASQPLSKAEADQWAQDAKSGNVRHFEIQNEVLLREHLVQIGKSAGGAAAIAVALQAAPVVVNALNRLIRDPNYTADAFGREVGTWAKEQGGAVALDAFTKASLGGALASAQQLGHLKGPLANASPATLGGLAVVAVESIKATWAWQQGDCTGEQAVSQTFACGVRTAAALQGAAIGQVVIPIPVVGTLIGTLAGSFLAEQGMRTMTNTTAVILLKQVDRTFALHQQHLDLLATTHDDYRAVAQHYEAILARGEHLIEAADRLELRGDEIRNTMNQTDLTAEEAVKAARRRRNLWNGDA